MKLTGRQHVWGEFTQPLFSLSFMEVICFQVTFLDVCHFSVMQLEYTLFKHWHTQWVIGNAGLVSLLNDSQKGHSLDEFGNLRFYLKLDKRFIIDRSKNSTMKSRLWNEVKRATSGKRAGANCEQSSCLTRLFQIKGRRQFHDDSKIYSFRSTVLK